MLSTVKMVTATTKDLADNVRTNLGARFNDRQIGLSEDDWDDGRGCPPRLALRALSSLQA